MDKEEKGDLKAYWHTSSHILAQAVKRLFPDVKLAIGPAIEQGFYYDFQRDQPFTPEDLTRIEEVMAKITKENLTVERLEKSKAEAREMEKAEPLKLEILEEIPDEKVFFYRQGDFVDLCSGPHLVSTGEVKHFKLLNVAAAYWKGDEKRESLQRIYGISFPEKKQLDDYLKFLEEARERDHRTLGAKLDLFSIHPEYGAGLIYWHPRGSLIRKIIEDFWREVHLKNGYQLLFSPHIADISLWEKSGHLSFYTEYMFPAMEISQEKQMELRPMNCPFHILVYQNKLRSYRELPIRWAELGTVYRLEKAGVLHGLMRVRGFTQDDAHIFCTPGQLEGEIVKLIDLACFLLGSFGFKDYQVFLSTRPEKFVGAVENWDKATRALEKALQKKNMHYQVNPGAGAFYGPKMDIEIKDCLGRAWQCTTIQVDFNIPERFDLRYVDEKGAFVQPIMIHRAILGSLERFFGVLLEHYKGNLPLWLAPVQARILTITDRQLPFAREMQERLGPELRLEIDERNEKISRKIRDAEEEKIPYMLIAGEKEVAEQKLAVRIHGKGMLGTFGPDEIRDRLMQEMETRGGRRFDSDLQKT